MPNLITFLKQPSSIGLLVLFSLLCVMGRGVGVEIPVQIAVAGYGLAVILCWPGLGSRNQKQCLFLICSGVFFIGFGLSGGQQFSLETMISGNLSLVSMLVAVSFLGLVSAPAVESAKDLPQGTRALRDTLIGVHLLGSVINLSSVFILGDRMSSKKPLTRQQAIALTRGFSAAAFWSPFFAAMGVAYTYAPDAKLSTILMVGIPLGIVAIAITYVELSRHDNVEAFVGYPIHYSSMWLPLLLALCVFGVRYRQPNFPILTLITLISPTITVLVLLAKRNKTFTKLRDHTREILPTMGNELALFLSAGVFSYGLRLIILSGDGSWLPFDTFGPTQASLCLGAALIAALLGFHPIITIAVMAPLLTPLNPDHTMLGIVFLAIWALGAAVGPLSGLNLAVQSRFQIEAISIMRWNLGFCFIMFLVTSMALFLL